METEKRNRRKFYKQSNFIDLSYSAKKEENLEDKALEKEKELMRKADTKGRE
jgi:hypothetical protein